MDLYPYAFVMRIFWVPFQRLKIQAAFRLQTFVAINAMFFEE